MKETKEALKFIFSLANGVGKSLQDGKFSYGDLVYFFGALESISEAMSGAKSIPAELKRMTPQQRQELLTYAKQEFDIPQDDIEKRVEQGLTAALHVLTVIEEFMD